jgi:thioredoxin:protein disulfide reductase
LLYGWSGLTFSDGQVKAAVADFILVQADVTKNDDADNGLLSHLNLIGPDAIERKNKRVVGFMNSEKFLRRIASLRHDES